MVICVSESEGPAAVLKLSEASVQQDGLADIHDSLYNLCTWWSEFKILPHYHLTFFLFRRRLSLWLGVLWDGTGVGDLLKDNCYFTRSLCCVRFARGVHRFLGDANLFPSARFGALVASPPRKCRLHTRMWGLIASSCKWKVCSHSCLLSGSLGKRCKETEASFALVLPHTTHRSPGIFVLSQLDLGTS